MVVCMHGSSAGAVMRAIPHPLSYESTVFLLALFKRFFSGFSGFPLSTKTNSVKFQDASYVIFAQDNNPFTKEKQDLEGEKRQGPVIMSSEDYR